MRQVVSLLDLKKRHESTVSVDVDCYECGRKGKLNINYEKQTYHCNYCDVRGGMCELYLHYRGLGHYTCAQARKMILDDLGIGTTYHVKIPQPEIKADTVSLSFRATEDEINRTYTALLDMLPLTPTHQMKLLQRGFSGAEIERLQYRSTPAFRYSRLAQQLIETGHTVEGVPGFYFQKETGMWSINFHQRTSGILIPVRSLDGKIVALQIRLDRPFDEGRKKYLWLSSTQLDKGCSSGSPVHLAGVPEADTFYVTEGILKSDLAHFLTGKSFIGVPSANQHKNLTPILQQLKGKNVKLFVEAFDRDKLTNPHVLSGAQKICGLIVQHGFAVKSLSWSDKFKGIDDWAFGKMQDKTIRKAKLIAQSPICGQFNPQKSCLFCRRCCFTQNHTLYCRSEHFGLAESHCPDFVGDPRIIPCWVCEHGREQENADGTKIVYCNAGHRACDRNCTLYLFSPVAFLQSKIQKERMNRSTNISR